jgi:hypothetical protein
LQINKTQQANRTGGRAVGEIRCAVSSKSHQKSEILFVRHNNQIELGAMGERERSIASLRRGWNSKTNILFLKICKFEK